MAADEPESADSLFADNSGDDFFGTVLATASPDEPAPESTQPASEDIFSSIPNEPDLFASQEQPQSQYEQPVQQPLSVYSNGSQSTVNGYSNPSQIYATVPVDERYQHAVPDYTQSQSQRSWYTSTPQNTYSPVATPEYNANVTGHNLSTTTGSAYDPYRPVSSSTTVQGENSGTRDAPSSHSYSAYNPLSIPPAPTMNPKPSSQSVDHYRPVTKSAYDPPVFASTRQVKQVKPPNIEYQVGPSVSHVYGVPPARTVEGPTRSQSVTMPLPRATPPRISQTPPISNIPPPPPSKLVHGRASPAVSTPTGVPSTAFRNATPPALLAPGPPRTPPVRQYHTPSPPAPGRPPVRPPSTSSRIDGTAHPESAMQNIISAADEGSATIASTSGYDITDLSSSVPFSDISKDDAPNGEQSISSQEASLLAAESHVLPPAVQEESRNIVPTDEGVSMYGSSDLQDMYTTNLVASDLPLQENSTSEHASVPDSGLPIIPPVDSSDASGDATHLFDEEGQTVTLDAPSVTTPSTGRSDQYTPRMRANTDSAKALVQLSDESDAHSPHLTMSSYAQLASTNGATRSDPYLPSNNPRNPYAPDLYAPATSKRAPPENNGRRPTIPPIRQDSIDGLPRSDKPFDPYAPVANGPETRSQMSNTANAYAPSSLANIPMPVFVPPVPYPYQVDEERVSPNEVHCQPHMQYATATNDLHHGLQYAPSPSLLGSNDPLSRTSSRAPVFSFGFGGRVASCFHLSQVSSGGFDVAMSSQEAKNIRVRVLHEVIQQSILDPSSSTTTLFPGPLFGDPGSVSTGIMSTGMAANVKAKRVLVLKYLEERTSEAEQGVGHLVMGSVERQKAESKLVLLRLLRVLVENDGSFNGSPSAENAVREVLAPNATSVGAQLYPTQSFATQFNEQPLAVSTVKQSSLVKLEGFLLAGEKLQAYHYALDERLWAHALLIASGLDKETWNEAVREFLRGELGNNQLQRAGPLKSAESFEGLKVAYSLFAGFGASSIQQLASTSNLSLNGPSSLPQQTPISPNFIMPAQPSAISAETLSKWRNIAAMAFNSQSPGCSATLTSMGDHLVANGWIEAAHCCYLLSPHTSSLGGAGLSSTRAVLLGSNNPLSLPNFHKTVDPFLLTEIAEFALSLAIPAKGQDAFTGLAHLQAYRLIRAQQIADMGHTAVAVRYCEAIGTSLRLNARGSPTFTQPLLEQLKELSDRLTGAPQQEKGKSWMIGKAKPSLDTLGGWLEGRIKNFIVGEGDTPSVADYPDTGNGENSAFTSAFSAYSAISSANSSRGPSPSPSIHGQSAPSHFTTYPPPRPPSGIQDIRAPINRSSSAMAHSRPDRRGSPVARMPSVSASATTTTFHDQSPLYSSRSTGTNNSQESSYDQTPPAGPSPWWGGSQEGSAGRTPTATTFFPVDGRAANDSFESGLDAPFVQSAPSTGAYGIMNSQHDNEEEDDDLGLGNSKPKSKQAPHGDSDQPSSPQDSKPVKPVEKTEAKESQEVKPSSSWLGWIWKRSDTPTSGPVRAKLGDESSFYYDKELKRWVNKKNAGEPNASTPPPPPPSRQATAPPSAPLQGSTRIQENGLKNASAPPLRPASAIDLGDPVSRAPPRSRSTLIPNGVSDPTSAPPSPPSRLTAGSAPPNRPKSSVAKRNIRSRYVDVFQQPPDGGGT